MANNPILSGLTHLLAGAQRQLPPGPARVTRGSIVRVLMDSTVGEVCWYSPAELVVIHADRALGRGPWPMHPSRVVPATADESAAYTSRCVEA